MPERCLPQAYLARKLQPPCLLRTGSNGSSIAPRKPIPTRDLLALDIKPGSKLPADDTGYGFDNIGDVLSLSPILIERYMSVGRMVSRLAVGDINRKPEVNEFEAPRLGRGARIERLSNDVPFDSVGGISIQYPFPVDAVYLFKIKMPGGGTAEPRVFEERIPVKAGTRTVAVTFLADNAAPEFVAGFGL